MTKHDDYKAELVSLQVHLVKYQQWAMKKGEKAVIVLEGRDGAGKDGAIKRITEHLAPRNTRVVALPAGGRRARAVQPLLVQPRRGRGGDAFLDAARTGRLPARRPGL
jgi:polyphosphate kinase 2 (PPK2 family)